MPSSPPACSHLANSLVTSAQLATPASSLDGVPIDLDVSVRFEGARLLQAAGVLLRLPQEIVARAITLYYRFWTGPDGGRLMEHDARDVAAATLYLCAKPSAHSVDPTQTVVVFAYLHSLTSHEWIATDRAALDPDRRLPTLNYQFDCNMLYKTEAKILRVLGFNTHVALPHPLCINYLQALDVFASSKGSAVACRALAHLNSALFSAQLLYLTHQPPALATAAIYLAAREVGLKLPENEWWEVFDTDREELGFLVVALRSVEGFVRDERCKWQDRRVPLTMQDLQAELVRRGIHDSDLQDE